MTTQLEALNRRMRLYLSEQDQHTRPVTQAQYEARKRVGGDLLGDLGQLLRERTQ